MARIMVDMMRNPHATRVIEQLRDSGSRFASSTLPELAHSARETGRSVADLAQSAGRSVVDRMPGHSATPLRRAVSGGMWRSARRLAARHPVMTLAGGLAVAGFALVVGQRMRAAREERALREGDQAERERTQERHFDTVERLAAETRGMQRRAPKSGLSDSSVDNAAQANIEGVS